MAGGFDPASFGAGFDTSGSGSFTIDATVRVNRSSSFTVDAVVATSSTITQSFTVDAVVRVARSSTFTINAVTRKSASGSFTVNAYVAERGFTLDAWVSVVSTTTWEGRNRHDRLDNHTGMTPASAISLSSSYPQYPGATNLFQLLQQMWDDKSATEAGQRLRFGALSLDAIVHALRTQGFTVNAYTIRGFFLNAIARAIMAGDLTVDAAVVVDDFLILDDFNRTTSPDSLGVASSGPTWFGGPFTDVVSNVNGTEWQFSQNDNTLGYSNYALYNMDHNTNFDDFTLLVRLKADALYTTGIALPDQYGNFEFTSALTGPGAGLFLYPDQDSDLHLFVANFGGGTDPYVDAVVDFVPGDSEWYILRWEHSPTNSVSRAKIWRENESEPGWLVTRDPTGDNAPSVPDQFKARVDGWTDARVDWIKVRHD